MGQSRWPRLAAHAAALLLLGFVQALHAQAPVVIRINAGGDAYTDSSGKAWSADAGFNTGATAVSAANLAVARTDDDALYRSNRFDFDGGDELAYSFTVPPGFYEVRLHFAETWSGAFAPGARVFDVEVENARVVQGLDVFARVGANTAYVRSLVAEVQDGALDIRFLRQVQNPNVSAIEIRTLRYRLTEVGGLGDRNTTVGRDMNELGWITGGYETSGYPFSVPFVARNAAPVAVTGSGTYSAAGVAINDAGLVAISGIPDNGGNGRPRTYLWNGTTVTEVGGNIFRGLNERSWVASYFAQSGIASGRFWDGTQQLSVTECNGCGAVVAVGGLNAAGLVVATEAGIPPSLNRGAFIWSVGAAPLFLAKLGGTDNEAQRISDRDLVVGRATNAGGAWRLVQWDAAGVHDLGDWPADGAVEDLNYAGAFVVGTSLDAVFWDGAQRLPVASLGGGGRVIARDVSEHSLVVGSALAASGARRALLSSGATSYDLNAFLEPGDQQRVTLTEAVKVNGRGQVLANGTDAGGATRPYILEPVDASPADTTPPEIDAAVAGTQGSTGWYRSNVSVSWTLRDPHSAIASSNGCATVVLTTDTPGVTYSCAATSAGGTGSKSVTVRRDATPPAVSTTRLPLANLSGWSNAPVTVSFFGTDALAGIGAGACTAPVVVAAEGANQSVPGSCSDLAGNSQASLVTGISIDLTPPVASATAGSAPNAAGWYRAPVTVTFAGADSLTGSGVATCSDAVVVSTEGRDQAASGSCTDRAGNSSLAARALLNLDRTAPAVTVTVPASGASYQQGATLNAAFTCTDALSGTTSCTGTVASGSAIATDSIGSRSFTVTATDAAGNSTTSAVTFSVVAAAAPPTTVPAPSPTPAPSASSGGGGGGGAMNPVSLAMLAGFALLAWRQRRGLRE